MFFCIRPVSTDKPQILVLEGGKVDQCIPTVSYKCTKNKYCQQKVEGKNTMTDCDSYFSDHTLTQLINSVIYNQLLDF